MVLAAQPLLILLRNVGSIRTCAATPSEVDVRNIRQVIEDNYKVEGDLRREIQLNIKRLKDLGCYRGLRQCGCLCAVSGQDQCAHVHAVL